MRDFEGERTATAREYEALEKKSADQLATEAVADFAYAEHSAQPDNREFWMARAATHAGLAAYKAAKEARGKSESTTAEPNSRLVHVVEATETTAVLRSPTTGLLYGIGMDQGPDGEEVSVTPLEEIETPDHPTGN